MNGQRLIRTLLMDLRFARTIMLTASSNVRACLTGAYRLVAALTILVPISLLPGLGQMSRRGLAESKQSPLWVYEAERESRQDGRLTGRWKVAYERGKFRIVREQYVDNGGTGKLAPPIVMTSFFDNSRPPVSWFYDERDHTATITSQTALYNLAWLAQRDGEAAVRQRYHVPERMLKGELLQGPRSPLRCSFYELDGLCIVMDPTADRFFARNYRKTGEALVAGYKCTVYEYGKPPFINRYWVEPKSHLALKVDKVGGNGAHLAPIHFVSVTTRIRFLKSLPAQTFQLPPGTIAYLPEAMKDTALPPGVLRKPMTGKEALLGFDPEAIRP